MGLAEGARRNQGSRPLKTSSSPWIPTPAGVPASLGGGLEIVGRRILAIGAAFQRPKAS